MGVGVEAGRGRRGSTSWGLRSVSKACRSDGRARDNEGGSVSGGESICG